MHDKKIDDKELEELARCVVAHHFGSEPFRLKVESGGLNNHVVTVQHPAGDFIRACVEGR